jgi:hypothetical protein
MGQLPVRARAHNVSGPERNDPANPIEPTPSFAFRFANWNSNGIHVFLPFVTLSLGGTEQCGSL